MKWQIPQPHNWQDFEDLCKNIFGEVWNCKYTIQKNGRQGQNQHGIDVYGIPKGEASYFGVQCKGKNVGLGKQLTIKEIDEEIEKAKNFDEHLTLFLFATTTARDAEIQKYIRQKNIESLKNGGFEIQVKFWDDLEEYLNQHQNLLNAYLSKTDFLSEYGVQVKLNGETDELTIQPKFAEVTTNYKLKDNSPLSMFESNFKIPQITMFPDNKVNHTWCPVELLIKNTGTNSLTNWKVYFTVESDLREISDDSDDGILASLSDIQSRELYVFDDTKQMTFSPNNDSPLTTNDYKVGTWLFLPNYDSKSINVNWELYADKFHKTGSIKIQLDPVLENVSKTIIVDKEELVRTTTEIKDLIKDGKSNDDTPADDTIEQEKIKIAEGKSKLEHEEKVQEYRRTEEAVEEADSQIKWIMNELRLELESFTNDFEPNNTELIHHPNSELVFRIKDKPLSLRINRNFFRQNDPIGKITFRFEIFCSSKIGERTPYEDLHDKTEVEEFFKIDIDRATGNVGWHLVKPNEERVRLKEEIVQTITKIWLKMYRGRFTKA